MNVVRSLHADGPIFERRWNDGGIEMAVLVVRKEFVGCVKDSM